MAGLPANSSSTLLESLSLPPLGPSLAVCPCATALEPTVPMPGVLPTLVLEDRQRTGQRWGSSEPRIHSEIWTALGTLQAPEAIWSDQGSVLPWDRSTKGGPAWKSTLLQEDLGRMYTVKSQGTPGWLDPLLHPRLETVEAPRPRGKP